MTQYVSKVNENFTELPIKKEDIEDNKAAREYYKLMMNSEIGKFTQNNLERTKTVLVKKASETVQLINNQQLSISTYKLMPDAKTLFVQYHTDGAFEPADRNFSCILGAFVTAHARVLLHKAIDCIDLKNGLVTYTDTDSLYYIQKMLPRYLIENIHDTKLGDWKNEIVNQQIIRAIFVGSKNKGVRLQNLKNLVNHTEINIRGFNLKQKQALQNLELNHMKAMVVEKMKAKKRYQKTQ